MRMVVLNRTVIEKVGQLFKDLLERLALVLQASLFNEKTEQDAACLLYLS